MQVTIYVTRLGHITLPKIRFDNEGYAPLENEEVLFHVDGNGDTTNQLIELGQKALEEAKRRKIDVKDRDFKFK